MRNYIPPDLARVDDPILRAILRPMDDWLRQASAQVSTNASNDASSAGNVSSLEVNSGGRITGAINFNNTATIGVFQAGQNITWGILSLPAVVFGAVSGLNATTLTTNGVALTAARSDHLHAVASGAQTGFYGTAATVGAGSDFLRASGVLVYPEALGTAADRADSLTLTDDGTEGALLTSAATFSVNSLALKAPNATNTLRVGIYGNFTMAGTALLDYVLCGFTKTNYNETQPVAGIVGTVTNTNVGAGTGAVRGIALVLSATMASAGAPSTNPLIGSTLALTAGATLNSNFTGSIFGHVLSSVTASASVIGTAIPAITGFQFGTTSNIITLTRVAVTDIFGVRVRPSASLLTSATVTNCTGYRCEAITSGTNRYGLDIAAISGGTLAYGVQIATHSGGTTRRAVIGGNTFESTANDFLCNTAAKGFICKDAAGTPVYWRYTVAADGTPAIVNAGTTAPAT